MPNTIRNTAIALRLARNDEGVTVSELAAMCGISRPSAHSLLRRLVEIGELVRSGGVGRAGHRYRVP